MRAFPPQGLLLPRGGGGRKRRHLRVFWRSLFFVSEWWVEIGRTGRDEGLKTRGLHGERKSYGKGGGVGTQQREKSPYISHRGFRWKKGESLFPFPRKREVICGVLARIQDSGKEGQRTQSLLCMTRRQIGRRGSVTRARSVLPIPPGKNGTMPTAGKRRPRGSSGVIFGMSKVTFCEACPKGIVIVHQDRGSI